MAAAKLREMFWVIELLGLNPNFNLTLNRNIKTLKLKPNLETVTLILQTWPINELADRTT